MFRKIIEKYNIYIMDQGTSAGYSSGINLTIKFSNVTSFFLSLLIFPYIFIFRSMGAVLLGNLCIPMVLFYASIPFINNKGHIKTTRILMTIVGHAIVLLYSIAFGKESGIYQLFIVTSFYSIMYFDKTERAKQIISILLTFFSVLTFFVYFMIYQKAPFVLSEWSYSILNPLLFLTTLILVFVFIVFYYLSKNRLVGELEDSLIHNEEDLISSRERFRILFERTNDALFLIDLETEKYLDANSAAELLTGRNVESLKDCATWDITPEGSHERTEKYLAVRQTMDFGEVVFRRPDGTERIALLSIIPLNNNTVFGFAKDITESKRSHDILIQNEKMLSIGGLAAGMAHEINNPLAGILQTANVMNNRLGAKLNLPKSVSAAEKAGTDIRAIKSFMADRHIDRMLRNIIDSGERISKIVSNMLSFIRNSENIKSYYSLVEIIDNTLDIASADYNISQDMDFKNIEIIRNYASDLPFVYCERSKIQQVLLNIFRNGADIMHNSNMGDPRFEIRMKPVRDRSTILIEIEDNGPGMDEQTKKRIFEPFFTTKPEGQGTGLGLSISYFIITEDHKGEMSVDSRKNHGAIFTIKLPVNKQ